MRRPVVVVVYTQGAARPLELAADADGFELVFAAPFGRMGAGLRELLESIGDVVDLTDEEAGIARLAARSPDGIVAFSDPDLPLAARVARRLGLTYHVEDAVAAATDKFEQRRRLRDAGLRVPRFAVIDAPGQVNDALAEVGAPAVLKPVRGAGSRHVYRIDGSEDALRCATEAFEHDFAERFVLEEMLVGSPEAAGPGFGDYVSAELLFWRGAVAYQVVNGRLPLVEPFRERGYVLPAPLSPTDGDEVCRQAAAACLALGLRDGWMDVELKLTADGPVVIEVNARMGGWVAMLLHRSCGMSAVQLAFEVAVGREPVDPGLPHHAVSFVYQFLPPIGDWRLASWGGLRALAAECPEIQNVILQSAPGDRLDWRAGSEGALGYVEGVAAHPDAVLAAVRALEKAVAEQVVFRPV
jgi:biotin carboxylase